jgi:ATP-dependent DNA ligase
VALGPDGRPDFNLLQNFRSAESRIIYYAFDILVHEGRHLTELPLSERRAILSSVVGFYRGKDLIYAARVRAGLVPATRREVF